VQVGGRAEGPGRAGRQRTLQLLPGAYHCPTQPSASKALGAPRSTLHHPDCPLPKMSTHDCCHLLPACPLACLLQG
jgi:hypothetical protein